jgi:FkbM family methyltransferase
MGLTSQARRCARTCDYAPSVVTIRHGDLSLQMHGVHGRDQIPNRIWWDGWESFEFPMSDLFALAVRDARLVLDIGANTGFYTLITLAGSKARIQAFEPFPFARDCMMKNLGLRDDAHRVTVHPCAVSDEAGSAELYVPTGVSSNLVETSCSLDPGFRPQHEAIRVEVLTLDDTLAGPDREQIDVIKVDVEGIESRVIAGAREVLQRSRPYIFTEILKEEYGAAVARAFEGLGYDLISITESGCALRSWSDPFGVSYDYVVVPTERLESFGQLVREAGLPWHGPATSRVAAARPH